MYGKTMGGDSEYKAPLHLPPLSNQELLENSWSDEEINCYVIASAPGLEGPYVAHIFDIRMRRWYTISAHRDQNALDDSLDELEDPFWFDPLKKTGHRGRTDFNHIDVDRSDNSITLSLLPTDFHRQCTSLLRLHPPPSHPTYPHVHFSALQDRKYLTYQVETCTWKGELCVFKQIILAYQVKLLDAEITMIGRLAHSPHIVQIIAYIVDDDGDLRGILLPWAGHTIDTLPSVRWTHFRDIAYGLKDIHSLKVSDSKLGEASHGDVFSRNILVKDGVARLIDLNNQGLGYPGDSEAFANLIESLKDMADGQLDRKRMNELEYWLRAGTSFVDIAVKMMDWSL